MAIATLDSAALRVAALLMGGANGAELSDPGAGLLELEADVVLRPLVQGPRPAAVWAVDGGQVLVAGDLQPDWRIPSEEMARLLDRAAGREVLLAGVTKHSSLARGGAPLLGQLEIEAGMHPALGPRALWWARLGRTRPDVGYGLQVVAARLDRDARFAFRVDLPAEADPEQALAAVAAVSDDAAFPGYPYPLTVADRLAACPRWLREEAWLGVDDALDRAGVPPEVRERAFADRHRLMERA